MRMRWIYLLDLFIDLFYFLLCFFFHLIEWILLRRPCPKAGFCRVKKKKNSEEWTEPGLSRAESRMMFFIFQYPDNWSVRWRFLNLKFSTIFYPKCQNNDAVIHFNLSVYIKKSWFDISFGSYRRRTIL